MNIKSFYIYKPGNRRSFIFYLLITLVVGHAFSQPTNAEKFNQNKKVPVFDTNSIKTILFIGNSLTYTNDLPAIVTGIGKEKGIEIKTAMIAYPDYALEDHWNDGQLQKMISKTHYDFVIVQQGPSSQADGRAMLMDYGARIKDLCTTYKTQLAFFMVWPAFSNLYNFDGVIKNYTDAAIVTNSLLCPVGKIWKEHFSSTNDYTYYGPDMFHPSQIGSEVAAKIIYETLFK
jgi:hypothetical protein